MNWFEKVKSMSVVERLSAEVPLDKRFFLRNGRSLNNIQDFVNELIKRIPMNRMAKQDEYQGILIFLLSSASSYVNGAIIAADGGRTAW